MKNYIDKKFKRTLTEQGRSFLTEKFQLLQHKEYIEEFTDIHKFLFGSKLTTIEKGEVQSNLIEAWAEWEPKNKKDLKILLQSNRKNFSINPFIRIKNSPTTTSKPGFLLLAAYQDFRCYFTHIPLMPIKTTRNQKKIWERYAWYPSVDHLDSNKAGDGRHDINNLFVIGKEINRMFGQYKKDIVLDMMKYLSSDRREPLYSDLARLISKESLHLSGRNTR